MRDRSVGEIGVRSRDRGNESSLSLHGGVEASESENSESYERSLSLSCCTRGLLIGCAGFKRISGRTPRGVDGLGDGRDRGSGTNDSLEVESIRRRIVLAFLEVGLSTTV